jgi:hypothetical protein
MNLIEEAYRLYETPELIKLGDKYFAVTGIELTCADAQLGTSYYIVVDQVPARGDKK